MNSIDEQSPFQIIRAGINGDIEFNSGISILEAIVTKIQPPTTRLQSATGSGKKAFHREVQTRRFVPRQPYYHDDGPPPGDD